MLFQTKRCSIKSTRSSQFGGLDAVVLEDLDQLLDVLLASRLDGQLDGDLADGVGEASVVRNLVDVRLRVRDEPRERRHAARHVGDDHAQTRESARLREPLVDEACERRDVDVAAADDTAHVLAEVLHLVVDDRGDRGGAGALDDDLLLLEERQQRLRDLALRDRDDLVDVLLAHGEGVCARQTHREAVGERLRGGDEDGLVLLHGELHARQHRGLHADDADGRLLLLQRTRDAGDQAAAADGDDDGVEVGVLLEQLQTDCALPSHDLEVVERVDEDLVLLLHHTLRFSSSIVEAVAEQDDVRAPAACVVHFDERSGQRHVNGGLW